MSSSSVTGAPAGLGRFTLFAMAASCGIAVANIYYNQPMLGVIEAEFAGQSSAGLIPTATQLGYALGLFLSLPLGDLVNRRRLIVGQFTLLAVSLALAALAPTAESLVAASVLVGVGATVAQQIIPLAASLVSGERRGATIGSLMSGLLSGILLSRGVSGAVGEYWGWREMFWLGVPMALGAAVTLALLLPDHAAVSRMRYRAAIVSLAHLWRRERALRTATMTQAALFASFSVFWTILALYLQGPVFGRGADVAGLFGLLGLVGVFVAPFAGRMADRRGSSLGIWLGAAMVLASWAMFGLWASLVALVIGVVVFDAGLQLVMISNQHIIYALDAQARSRINTLYMTGMFLGGAAGSGSASLAWEAGGWPAVSLLGAGFALLALVVQSLERWRRAS